MKQENMQANTKGQMAAQQQKHEFDVQIEQVKSQLEKDEMTHEHMLETRGMAIEKAADASMQGSLQGAAAQQQQVPTPGM
jgi:hypothetical protein